MLIPANSARRRHSRRQKQKRLTINTALTNRLCGTTHGERG
jgi:hypothetical protein